MLKPKTIGFKVEDELFDYYHESSPTKKAKLRIKWREMLILEKKMDDFKAEMKLEDLGE